MKTVILSCCLALSLFSFTGCASDEHTSTTTESSSTMHYSDSKEIKQSH